MLFRSPLHASRMRVKIPSNEAWSGRGKIKIKEAMQTMAPTGDMVVKIHQMERKTQSRDINAEKKIKLGNGGKQKRERQKAPPIDHDMGAMVIGDVGGRWDKK